MRKLKDTKCNIEKSKYSATSKMQYAESEEDWPDFNVTQQQESLKWIYKRQKRKP